MDVVYEYKAEGRICILLLACVHIHIQPLMRAHVPNGPELADQL